MRYVAALLVLLFFAAAAAPAEAGPYGRNGGHGGQHGDMGHEPRGHGHGPSGHEPNGHGPNSHGPNGHRPDGHRPDGMRPHGTRPLHQILGNIRRHHPGRLSDVRPVRGPNGEPYLRVKWLTPEGRVLWLDVDATTGQEVNIRSDAGHSQTGQGG